MSECACCMHVNQTLLFWCGNNKCSYHMCCECTGSATRLSTLCPCCRTTAVYRRVLCQEVENRSNVVPVIVCTFWCAGYAVATAVDQIKPNIAGVPGAALHFAHGCVGCLYMLLFVLLGTFAVQPGAWYALLREPQQ